MQAGRAKMFCYPNSPQALTTARQSDLRKYGIVLKTGYNVKAVTVTV